MKLKTLNVKHEMKKLKLRKIVSIFELIFIEKRLLIIMRVTFKKVESKLSINSTVKNFLCEFQFYFQMKTFSFLSKTKSTFFIVSFEFISAFVVNFLIKADENTLKINRSM
jgi:hypothetical protein